MALETGTVDPITQALFTGCRLYEQIKQLDSASATRRAIYEGLDDHEARAIVLHLASQWHQCTEDDDSYASWWSR